MVGMNSTAVASSEESAPCRIRIRVGMPLLLRCCQYFGREPSFATSSIPFDGPSTQVTTMVSAP